MQTLSFLVFREGGIGIISPFSEDIDVKSMLDLIMIVILEIIIVWV